MSSSSNKAESKPALRRPVKRKSALEAIAKSTKPPKLSVLEKSKLDWAGFVDKEGIKDDLTQYNKDGYVERQEFLKRAR
jgi:Bucentaur or craniofacial development